jgi:exosome complex exonuclease DIS3/RRP44
VQGRENVNRALDGDVVAIEIVHEEDEKVTASSVDSNTIGDSATNNPAAGVGEVNQGTMEASTALIEGLSVGGSAAAPLRGRVVGIIRRNWKQYAGSLIPFNDPHSSAYSKGVDANSSAAVDEAALDDDLMVSEKALFIPLDKKLPRVVVSTRRLKQLMTQRVLVNIDSWPTNSPYPLGHFVRSFGAYGSKDVETAVLLHEYEVPHDAFSPAVMACLPPTDWRITEELVAQRTDLRHLPVVSVDPPGCKDIDDALHCRRLPNGNFEVGVHIADVGYFVDPGSPLDLEAQHRSTSTYLVERRLDMLPGYLTTQLCSLRCKEDHLAFSVIWEMDQNANIIDVSFCKSVIHSIASLSYGEAQAILDDPSRGGEMCESLRHLNRLAKQLGQRRREAGALTLASSEVRFQFADDSADPTDVTSYELKESNSMVEEWMLIANITVAKKILRHYPTLSILRRHQPPSKQQFAPLLAAAQAVGVRLVIDSSKTLADSLDAATRKDDPMFNKLLRMLSTRCMQPAQYFCSGELPKDQWHHYGLATPVYTHFTSPIRRYADLLVHRLLAAAINVTSLPVQNADRIRQHDICTHMNRRHKAAQYIQRDSVKLHTLLYFRKNPSSENAYILTVAKDRFNVIIPKFGIESAIEIPAIVRHMWSKALPEKKLRRLDNDAYINGFAFDPDRYTISIFSDAEHSGVLKTYRVFDKVTVQISVSEESTDGAPQRTLVIELLDDEGNPIKNVSFDVEPTPSTKASSSAAIAEEASSKGPKPSITAPPSKRAKVEVTIGNDKKKGRMKK